MMGAQELINLSRVLATRAELQRGELPANSRYEDRLDGNSSYFGLCNNPADERSWPAGESRTMYVSARDVPARLAR